MLAVGPGAEEIGDGAEMLELVGVNHTAHRLDDAVEYLQGDYAHDSTLGVAADNPRSSVNEGRFVYCAELQVPTEDFEKECSNLISAA